MQGFDKNSSSFFGGDAIKVKIKDGYRQPNLSTGPNHFWMVTTHRETSQTSFEKSSGLGEDAK